MPYVPPHLLDGSLFRQAAPPPGLFDILQPGMLRQGGGQLFSPMGNDWWQGATANEAGSAGGIGGMTNNPSEASNPASGLSMPATAANVANAALGLVGALSPTGMVGLVGNAVAGKSPVDTTVGKTVTGLLGMLGLDDGTGVSATGTTGSSAGIGGGASGSAGVSGVSATGEVGSSAGIGDGASGGAGGSVICTELRRLGIMSEQLYEMAHLGRPVHPVVLNGYHLWAVPYVKAMRRWAFPRKVAAPLALAWARFRAHALAPEAYPEPCRLGMAVHYVGGSLCALLGLVAPCVEWRQLYTGWNAGYPWPTR